ncbi:hypothetical protein CW751_04100 [Brumimicrobium salinarum]|uniref:Secretion system C-terminal sorting domain-containing protein n=1 Tax=Brumimicrobium salinarum TaxID=2058658 RepID=A0A2I0R558_9FLAO|nr:choice-of-anchor B family protein [Brumimicrobium salinarum]PKR81717.1 hypothetical protein CW751_04100 [Brumimicrobium salinarum]
MCKVLTGCMILFSFITTIAQNHHIDSISHLDYNSLHNTQLNDVWGYTDELGNEYAIVGAAKGVSIVDISNPSNPIEVYWHSASESVWRDIKTFGDYVYITTEAEDGLLILDLSPLPNGTITQSVNYFGDSRPWETAHNIFIDEMGYGYIFGSNYGNGGAIILDLFTDPMSPVEVGVYDNWYIHDGYVENDTLYAAHINDGFFTVVDMTDKSNPVVLGMQGTPSSFSHNIWCTNNQEYAFTTDEVSGGFLTAYDISDPTNIFEVDRTQSSPNSGVVPHNTHVKGDYLITSYYADGVVVHDVSDPENMIEVARFDTYPGTAKFTTGNWGVYPYFNSGHILVTDIEHGLFILKENYGAAAKLVGTVSNASTSNTIQGVTVKILNTPSIESTKTDGTYKTGTAFSGSYQVRYEKYGYETQDININLIAGNLIQHDVDLVPLSQYPVKIKVVDEDSIPILNAQVKIKHQDQVFNLFTNGLGEVNQQLSYSDTFTIHTGKWGYQSKCITTVLSPTSNEVIMQLNNGYSDDFSFDFGWSTTSSADQGAWERGIPYTVQDSTFPSVPISDSPFDCGNHAFITGNSADNSVMGGDVVLISPIFDLLNYTEPYLNYDRWFFDYHGHIPFNDTLRIGISNGSDFVEIDKIGYDENTIGRWLRVSKRIEDFITPSSTMQLFVQTSNYYSENNIVNAAFDNFLISDNGPLMVDESFKEKGKITVYPNPFKHNFTVESTKELDVKSVQLFNVYGALIKIQGIQLTPHKVKLLTDSLPSGTYFLKIDDFRKILVK